MLLLLSVGHIPSLSEFIFGNAQGCFHPALCNSEAKKKNSTISFLVFKRSLRFTESQTFSLADGTTLNCESWRCWFWCHFCLLGTQSCSFQRKQEPHSLSGTRSASLLNGGRTFSSLCPFSLQNTRGCGIWGHSLVVTMVVVLCWQFDWRVFSNPNDPMVLLNTRWHFKDH